MGGLENGVVNLINRLDWQRYDHVVCCITRSGRSAGRLRRDDVHIIELGKPQGNDWYLPLRLASLFRKLSPHIVHTRNWGTIDGIIGARIGRVPVVIHGEHGYSMAEVDGNNHKRTIVRWALSPFVDRFVTVSKSLQDWLQNTVGIDEHKITTICNGVDLARFDNVCSKQAVRAAYGFRQDEFLIGTVGRLDPIKNQACLLRVLRDLVPQYPYARLLIVGHGPCYEQLREQTQQLGLADRVVLMGERDDIPQLLQSLDVFVLPSLSEGIANTILEAMATGLPVIATRVGGNVELVLDRETGFLIPSRNDFALSEAIQVYLREPSLAYQHGTAGRQRVVQRFSLSKMVETYDSLYSGLDHQNV